MESEHISRFVFNKFWEDAKRRFYAPTVTNGMQLLCDKLRVGVNLIAGRPRMGCSSLAISMAVALAKQGRRVLFVTAHRQGFYSQISRNLAVEFGLDASKCSDLTAYDAEMSNIKEPIEKLPIRHMGMYYDWQDDYLSLRSLLRGEKRRNDMQYIFIDCLQDMSADSRLLNGLTQEEYLCRNFRSLADELDVPIIAVTRLNNGPARRGVIEGLHDCVWNNDLGTASVLKWMGNIVDYKAQSNKVAIMGKTGSLRLDESGRKHRISFVGIFPENDPQYTCMVMFNAPKNFPFYDAGMDCGSTVRIIAERIM